MKEEEEEVEDEGKTAILASPRWSHCDDNAIVELPNEECDHFFLPLLNKLFN